MNKKVSPKNLNKALSKNSEKIAENFRLEDNGAFHVEKMLAENESSFWEFVGSLAREHMTYGHSSDLLENATEYEVQEFLNGKRPVRDWDDDASDDYEDSSETFDKHDKYDEIKDKFKEKLDPVLKTESYSSMDSFAEIYKIAKKYKFKGNEATFERYLKTSEVFREWAKHTLTEYTG